MKIRLHTKVTLIVALASLPFAFSGGFVWRDGVAIGQSREPSFYYADVMGTALYAFIGFPFRGILMKILSPLRFEDHIWAIPLLSITVVVQWVLWANLVVWVVRCFKNRKKDGSQQGHPADRR
jgi:hypothetical protein